MSREMLLSSRLLPSHPSRYKHQYPPDSKQIIRTKFFGKDPTNSTTWYLNGNFSKGSYTFKFLVKEIDLSADIIQEGDEAVEESDSIFSRTENNNSNQNNEASTKLMKELYILHYFKHENFLHAYFTRTDFYRLNIALPRIIPLLKLSKTFNLQYYWQQCSSMPYVAICILRAIAFLHGKDIVHGNVSIENCALDYDGNVLLGGFSRVGISDKDEEKARDVWNVGTTILDFVLGTDEYGNDFGDPSCTDGYGSLFEKMSKPRSNNNPSNLPLRLGYIYSLISRDSQLIKFLDCIFQAQNRPSAKYFLQQYPYTAITDEQFKQYKHELAHKCYKHKDIDIKPFCSYRNISTLFQTINACRIPNVLKAKSKFLQEDFSCSDYTSNIHTPIRKIKNGSNIAVIFTMISDPPISCEGSFIVDSEDTMLKLLLDLIDFQLYFPWDIFCLRTALETMLVEGAHGYGNTRMCNDNLLISNRQFPLCNSEEGFPRQVEIEIKCSRDDVIKIGTDKLKDYCNIFCAI